MFAPEPDHMNHRLHVVVEFASGKQREWRSPDWPERSNWRRFVTSRELEYYDEIHAASDTPLEEFADWLLRTQPEFAGEGPPQRIEIWREVAEIPDPRFHGWQPRALVLPRDKRTSIFEKDFE
jgi:hypothetical protein